MSHPVTDYISEQFRALRHRPGRTKVAENKSIFNNTRRGEMFGTLTKLHEMILEEDRPQIYPDLSGPALYFSAQNDRIHLHHYPRKIKIYFVLRIRASCTEEYLGQLRLILCVWPGSGWTEAQQRWLNNSTRWRLQRGEGEMAAGRQTSAIFPIIPKLSHCRLNLEAQCQNRVSAWDFCFVLPNSEASLAPARHF